MALGMDRPWKGQGRNGICGMALGMDKPWKNGVMDRLQKGQGQ